MPSRFSVKASKISSLRKKPENLEGGRGTGYRPGEPGTSLTERTEAHSNNAFEFPADAVRLHYFRLLVAQRLQRINAGGAAGWDGSGDQGYYSQHQRDPGESCGVCGCNAEEERFHQACQSEGGR